MYMKKIDKISNKGIMNIPILQLYFVKNTKMHINSRNDYSFILI